MKISGKLSAKWVVVLVLVSVIGTAAAVLALFQHTFPAVTTAAPVLTTVCDFANLQMNPSQVALASGGSIVATCNGMPPGRVAFTVANTGSATPTFPALPTGYTALAIFRDDPGTATGCGSLSTGYVSLTSGTPVAFTVGGGGVSYDYCLSFLNAPAAGLGTFSVSWTQ